jgi:hypothetical protein
MEPDEKRDTYTHPSQPSQPSGQKPCDGMRCPTLHWPCCAGRQVGMQHGLVIAGSRPNITLQSYERKAPHAAEMPQPTVGIRRDGGGQKVGCIAGVEGLGLLTLRAGDRSLICFCRGRWILGLVIWCYMRQTLRDGAN